MKNKGDLNFQRVMRSAALVLLAALLLPLEVFEAHAFPPRIAQQASMHTQAVEAALRRRLQRLRHRQRIRQNQPDALVKQPVARPVRKAGARKRKHMAAQEQRIAFRQRLKRLRAGHIKGRIACVNGRKVRERCQCAPGATLLRTKPNMFVCLQKGAKLSGAILRAPPVKAPRLRQRFARQVTLATVPLQTSQVSLEALAARHGLVIVASWPIKIAGRRVLKFRFSDGRSIEAVQAELRREPLIISLQNNYYYERQSAAPASSEGLPQYALTRMDALGAHEIAQGTGVVVAIVDSGIDADHPDLTGQVIKSMDATGGSSETLDPHGTAIAGLVAAHGLLLGVAPDARLLDVRVFERLPDEDAPAATTEALLRGLDWAVEQKADIINLSLTGPQDPLMQEVVAAIIGRGIIVVAAAGNNGAGAEPAYPAAYDDVIAVTATGENDAAYSDANQGDYIDVAAPGVDVLVAAPDDAYRFDTGTSIAAAEVTGVVALLLSQTPHMTVDQIVGALGEGAQDIGAPGRDPQFGAGRVNALNSLRAN